MEEVEWKQLLIGQNSCFSVSRETFSGGVECRISKSNSNRTTTRSFLLMIRQMFMLIRLSKYLGHSVVLHAISGGSIKIWQKIMFERVAERFPSDYVFVIKSKISRQWKAEIKKKSATETIARDIKKLIVLSATHNCSVCVCIPYCLGEPSINVNWRKALRSNRH